MAPWVWAAAVCHRAGCLRAGRLFAAGWSLYFHCVKDANEFPLPSLSVTSTISLLVLALLQHQQSGGWGAPRKQPGGWGGAFEAGRPQDPLLCGQNPFSAFTMRPIMGTTHGSMQIHRFHRLEYQRTVLVSITTWYYLFICVHGYSHSGVCFEVPMIEHAQPFSCRKLIELGRVVWLMLQEALSCAQRGC